MEPVIRRMIIKRARGVAEEVEDSIAVEQKLSISVNGNELVQISCSPCMIKELVIGFLLTEGITSEHICPDSVQIIQGEDIKADVMTDASPSLPSIVRTSGCGGGIASLPGNFERITDRFSLQQQDIERLFIDFHRGAELFRMTGCVHSAALSDGKILHILAEDIGRHNAVDKVLGHCIIQNIRFQNTLMLASGRLSSEMVSKCARWRIPMLASRTAPTSLAISIAEKAGITLIGFLRGKRMNVYTHGNRISG